MLTTAPISSPPALPPWMTSRSVDVYLFFDQVLGAVDEVVEGVLLLHHAALFAPFLAQLAAAADVRDHVNHAAIEQAETARRKRRRSG